MLRSENWVLLTDDGTNVVAGNGNYRWTGTLTQTLMGQVAIPEL